MLTKILLNDIIYPKWFTISYIHDRQVMIGNKGNGCMSQRAGVGESRYKVIAE